MLKDDAVKVQANLENSAVATELGKVYSLCLSGFSDQVLVWLLKPLLPGNLNSDLCLLGT